MDIVITNIDDQKNNLELLFVLRSIEKNLIGFKKIFLIGHAPDWIDKEKIIHIDYKNAGLPKNIDIANRIFTGASQKEISANFIHFTDDVMVLKPMNVKDIKSWNKGEINGGKNTPYGLVLKNSKEYYEEKEVTTINYDHHYPFLFNKKKLIESYKKANIFGCGKEILSRSTYGNYIKLKSEQVKDCKGSDFTLGFISTNDFNSNFLFDKIKKMFPEKSSFESKEVILHKADGNSYVKFKHNGKINNNTYTIKEKLALILQKAGYGNIID